METSSTIISSLRPNSSDDFEAVLLQLQMFLRRRHRRLCQFSIVFHLLTPNPSEIVEADKRARSIVVYGVAEWDQDMTSTCRQKSTGNSLATTLNALDLAVRPTEVYRLGRKTPDKNRLIKCVFLSRRFYFEVLKNARLLRNIPEFSNVYIWKSLTLNERLKDKVFRARAGELYGSGHNGERIYVVYNGQVVKSPTLQTRKRQKTS